MDLWLHALRFKYKDILVIDLNFFNAEWETFSPWPRHLSDTAGQRYVTSHTTTIVPHTHSFSASSHLYLIVFPPKGQGSCQYSS